MSTRPQKRRMVVYKGERMTIYRLASCVPVSYTTLLERYDKGEREPEIWRPMDPRGRKRSGNGPALAELVGQAQFNASVRERERLEREARAERERERAERKEAIRREIAELRLRPLISADLVSDRERRETVKRVMNSGQRQWNRNGGAITQ